MEPKESREPRLVGRYMLFAEIASGGMATVHLGRLVGPVGFTRLVAIKCLHRHFCRDPEFVAMFLDEARIAARIRHPNVVQVLDVVPAEGELFLVMDYVEGESLAKLLRITVESTGKPPPARIASAVLCGTLQGLHAAHEAKGEGGELLGVVHRDVSPQNILVGADGIPRVLDFGIAKAVGRMQITRAGQVKGKLAYMAPEQIRFEESITRSTDLYAASVVLWEMLTGSRLFTGDESTIVSAVLAGKVPRPRAIEPSVSAELDALVMRGLSLEPRQRFASAREMALAIESCVGVASAAEVSDWVATMAGRTLANRAELVAALESGPHFAAAPQSEPDDAQVPTQPRAVLIERPAPARRRTAIAVGVGALGATVVVLAVAALDGAREPAGGPSAPSEAPSTPAPVMSARAEATVVATEAPSGVPSVRPFARIARPAPPAPSKDPCAVPYYFDTQGVKRYKRECL